MPAVPVHATRDRPVRIANISGFYGDRLAAPREMLAGPEPIDVLTGDYLAELTMLILWKAEQREPATGYAATFLRQMHDVLATCLDRGVRIVSNAGGLNPRALRDRLSELAATLGVTARVAVVEGDDLRGDLSRVDAPGVDLAATPIATANAYLGGFGIARALAAGADVVVCGRVTDASLVVGPAAWWHGWARDDWDAIAGAVVAGHVVECGAQATGGNYPFLSELAPGYPGFPIAEVARDGTSIITKQPGTGGAVSVGTVTAQLLYEIAAPEYLNPDAVAHFDTIRLEAAGLDRVRLRGVRGSPPPDTLKVALNLHGGYRNTMTLVLTGLDIERKAAHAESLLFEVLGAREQFAEVDVQLLRTDHTDAPTNAMATAQLRITVKDADAQKVGRRFSNAVIELALASYAGFFATGGPGRESAFGIYRPGTVSAAAVEHTVVHHDGTREAVAHPRATAPSAGRGAASRAPGTSAAAGRSWGETVRAPLGVVCGARSGDKGGDANVGLWTRTAEAYAWLAEHVTVERARQLVPEASDLPIARYELANLNALNFVFAGLLGQGVASSTRYDAQAKSLGEYMRSRYVDVPVALLDQGASPVGHATPVPPRPQ